ncbi:F-box/FBD/LRR-repeat protein-like protein [Tanacetum coccineum]
MFPTGTILALSVLTQGIDAYHVFKSCKKHCSIINLFECLPVVESLSISLCIIQSFHPSVHDRFPRELPTALIHLKYLTINGVSFCHKDGLSILVLLMKSSPNLEKLKIDNGNLDVDCVFREASLLSDDDICSFTLKDYADIWLEHLNELNIGCFKNQRNELNFVKLILAKSPVLKKVMIYLDHVEVSYAKELQICKVLLSSPRASPVMDNEKYDLLSFECAETLKVEEDLIANSDNRVLSNGHEQRVKQGECNRHDTSWEVPPRHNMRLGALITTSLRSE